MGRQVLPAILRGAIRNRFVPPQNGRDVRGQRPEFLRNLRRRVEDICVGGPRTSNGRAADTFEPDRRAAVERAVEAVRPASVFEVAYDGPFHCTLAMGARSVAVGVDEGRVERLFRRAKAERLGVLPLVMDIRCPSPGYGVCGQTSAPATERLAGDLVIALDVVHQLGVRYRLNFDQVARALGTFARRAVLVDFVDAEQHPATRDYWGDDFVGYSAENFRTALGRAFARVDPIEGTTRATFLCHKGEAS
jgi:hypothetical protein